MTTPKRKAVNPSSKATKIRKSLRSLLRNKLTRLRTRLRREPLRLHFRGRPRPPLWTTARPYLRKNLRRPSLHKRHLSKLPHSSARGGAAPLQGGFTCRYLPRKTTPTQRPRYVVARGKFAKRVVLLPQITGVCSPDSTAATTRVTTRDGVRTKITAALLRRKQPHYKKVAHRFLKACRLRWLWSFRSGRQKTLPQSRSHRRTLLLRRLKLLKLTRCRAVRPTRHRSPARRPRRGRELQSYIGRRSRLRLRGAYRRKCRKLRRIIGKRVSVRSRRALLAATSHPVRKYLHYKRLLFARRLSVDIEQLRKLRPTRRQKVSRQQRRHNTAIALRWRSKLTATATITNRGILSPVLRKASTRKGAVRLAGKPSILVTRIPDWLACLTISPKELTVNGESKKLTVTPAKHKTLPVPVTDNKGVAPGKFFRTRPIGPRTRAEATAAALRLVNGYADHLPTTRYLARCNFYRNRTQLARQGHRFPLRLRPYRKVTLYRSSHENRTRIMYSAAVRSHLSLMNVRLAALKRQQIVGKATRYLRHATAHFSASALRLKEYRSRRGNLPFQQQQPSTIHPLSTQERQWTFSASGLRTSADQQPLIRHYRRASQLSCPNLYDPRPLAYFAPGRPLPRKSLRHSRRLAKERRVPLTKSKRSLRKKARRKVIVTRKRIYSYTSRSAARAVHTVSWKGRGIYRRRVHQRLLLTRGLFKELLRVKQSTTPTARLLPTPRAPLQEKMSASGRTLLLALLRLISGAPATSTSAPSRLRTAIRLFLRRNALPTAPAMRLLILKAFTTATAGTPQQRVQLLALERRWLSTSHHSCTTRSRLPKKIRRIRKMQSKPKEKKQSGTTILTLPPYSGIKTARPLLARLHRGAKLFSKKRLSRKRLSHKEVKHPLSKRKFAALLLRLTPKRRQSKKRVVWLNRQRARTYSNWRRLRSYRRKRLLTFNLLFRSARTALRVSGQQSLHLRANQPVNCHTYHARCKKQQLRTFRASINLIAKLQQQRLRGENYMPTSRTKSLTTRLDSARLRFHKALLWKAPLQQHPTVNLPARKSVNWHALSATQERRQLKEEHKMLRLPLPVKQCSLLAAATTRRWRAVRINRRSALPLPGYKPVKIRKAVVTQGKLLPRKHFSRIGRAAARPRLLDFRIVLPRASRKKRQTIEANPFRIRSFRSRPYRRTLFFRKNRLFMRRRATRGLKLAFRGKLRQRPGFPAYADRPLRTRLRRSKPLRRSLRRKLATTRLLKRRPLRYTKYRASTGRVLKVLKRTYHRDKRWLRKKFRNEHRAAEHKLRTVNQLLQQFTALSAPQLLHPFRSRRATSIRKKGRPRQLLVSPLRPLLQAHRRTVKIHRLRAFATTNGITLSRRRITIQMKSKHRRASYIPPRRRNRWKMLKWHPKLTPGKRRWMRRVIRRRRRLITPIPSNGYLLPAPLTRNRRQRKSKQRTTLKVQHPLARFLYMPGIHKSHPAQVTPHRKGQVHTPHAKKGPATPTLQVSTVAKKQVPQKVAVTRKPTPLTGPAAQLGNWSPDSVKTTKSKPQTPAKLPHHRKQRTAPVLTGSEALLSAPTAKKVTRFRGEADIHSEKAYVAVMSGLKGAWTQLQDATATVPLEQRETDVRVLEGLYTKHYGAIIRFDLTTVPDFKYYKGRRLNRPDTK